jgi:hypothetical protein
MNGNMKTLGEEKILGNGVWLPRMFNNMTIYCDANFIGRVTVAKGADRQLKHVYAKLVNSGTSNYNTKDKGSWDKGSNKTSS